jgi:hypothetical protein
MAKEDADRTLQRFTGFVAKNCSSDCRKQGRYFGGKKWSVEYLQTICFAPPYTKLGLEAAPAGQKPSFSHFAVKVAGFHRGVVTARLGKLGVSVEPGSEKGSLRFRDLHNLAVEVVAD